MALAEGDSNFLDPEGDKMYIPIWLVILAAVILFILYKNKDKKDEFLPIRISIEPKWSDLFKDYKLASDNAWQKRMPEGKEYNVLKKGLTFTLLDRDLVYDDDYHHFQTGVNIRRQIDELAPSQAQWIGLYVKPEIEGYEIGLTTFESRRKSHMPGDGLECIKVATIPYSELRFPFYDKQGKKKQTEINENLQKHGWTRQAPDIELSLVAPEVYLEHKYFVASYEYI